MLLQIGLAVVLRSDEARNFLRFNLAPGLLIRVGIQIADPDEDQARKPFILEAWAVWELRQDAIPLWVISLVPGGSAAGLLPPVAAGRAPLAPGNAGAWCVAAALGSASKPPSGCWLRDCGGGCNGALLCLHC